MATLQAPLPVNDQQTLTVSQTITITADLQHQTLLIDPVSFVVAPGQTIQWTLGDIGTQPNPAPFAIAFANPLFAAPLMVFGTSPDGVSASFTPVFTIPTPLLSTSSAGAVSFAYQVMYMDIITTQQYKFITSDPVVIVDPSNGS